MCVTMEKWKSNANDLIVIIRIISKLIAKIKFRIIGSRLELTVAICLGDWNRKFTTDHLLNNNLIMFSVATGYSVLRRLFSLLRRFASVYFYILNAEESGIHCVSTALMTSFHWKTVLHRYQLQLFRRTI